MRIDISRVKKDIADRTSQNAKNRRENAKRVSVPKSTSTASIPTPKNLLSPSSTNTHNKTQTKVLMAHEYFKMTGQSLGENEKLKKLDANLSGQEFERCITIYADSLEDFYNSYYSALATLIDEHEEIEDFTIGEIEINNSGSVPNGYVSKAIKNPGVAILRDDQLGNLILQRKGFYEVLIPA
jgi:hypothetical protein